MIGEGVFRISWAKDKESDSIAGVFNALANEQLGEIVLPFGTENKRDSWLVFPFLFNTFILKLIRSSPFHVPGAGIMYP